MKINKRKLFPLLLLGMFACGTSPNDMERNPFSEEMNARKIKKIDQTDLITFSKEKGAEISKLLTSGSPQKNALLMDSLQKKGVVVKFLDSVSVVGASPLEQQIMEAYYATDKANLSDNVQEVSKGAFILYNYPVYGDSSLSGMYSILFKKDFLMKHLNAKGKF
ncbi:MAG: hypothetical protein GY827_00525 [Cytophagales bacterium]|nr:hypothetical protein [Cytophagales bacterium]